MRRKGQLLTIDALLSLVIVVMVVGVVLNTNDMIKAEITNLLDWYDRANIANNMLDVLTKNPGYPENWEENASGVKVVGLRDKDYSFALDYDKIITFNKSKDDMKDILNQLARGKDFLFEIYVSRFNVSIEGRFPRVYLDKVTFKNPNPPPEGVVFFIATEADANNPSSFEVSFVEVIQDGVDYVNENVCNTPPKNGNVIFLDKGDYVKFVVLQDVYIKAERGKYQESILIPNNSVIEFFMTDPQSAFHIDYGGGECPYKFKFSGIGDVVVTVSAYDNIFPILNSTYTSSRTFWECGEPFYRLSLINGSYYSDLNLITPSMSRSPWVELAERQSVISRRAYNLSAGPSAEDPLIYGFMAHRVLDGTSLLVKVPLEPGNLSLLSMLGTEVRGVFVYKNSSGLNVNGTLVWYENGEPKVKGYYGENNTIVIPFEELFGSEDTEGKIIGLWLYSLNGWSRENVTIEVIPTIEYMLEPKFEPVLIRLLVWDDR
ncbi:hypothetical protein E3E22_04650 [Thermococcus sp. MV5]|uniref:hypothetical protein n=1 Tax=Thermococcus sp. MV5 TaxID=1638272 RepID=UPI00143C67DA|nr:hypothetical protein [Thermococcus sp. MV5]NJE25920.1 hypothetical protein [Thermococcus sp. MV5]